MKSAGVLGGTRFIGFHLVQQLRESNFHVTVFHRGRTSPPLKFAPDVQVIYGDRNKPSDLQNFFSRDHDTVFDISGYTPRQVDYVLAHRPRIGHYIFCSTPLVMVQPPPVPHCENTPIVYKANSYGGDKALSERLLLDVAQKYQFPVTILRPYGVLGPYDPAQAGFVFYRLKKNISISASHRLFNMRTSLLDVRDLAKVFISVATSPAAHGKIYNVANDDPISLSEFVDLCGAVCSSPPNLHFVDGSLHGEERENIAHGLGWQQYDFVADNSCIKKDLNISFLPLRMTLEDVWSWLQNNPRYLNMGKPRVDRLILQNSYFAFVVTTYRRLREKL